MATGKTVSKKSFRKGKLKIGDNWNAITIIALSQSNPLKAIAEFVENSIDANASNITIIRGCEKGEYFIRIIDDGDGIPLDGDERPDFKYVATHICDSIKREMKARGVHGIQGEFGIGLLSFWTVGDGLFITSAGRDGRNYQMVMNKGDPGYVVREKRSLLPVQGVELIVKPLLPAVRQISGEKIQWYLASELRDRIRSSGVTIKVTDRRARKEFVVEPRKFSGRLLHGIGQIESPEGEIYSEIYLGDTESHERISLYRAGTRVLEDITEIEIFNHEPWTSPYLQGIIDASFLNLTPGTRSGVIHDESLQVLINALSPTEQQLKQIIEEQRRAEEERASARILRSVQKALKEALMALPVEEYDWFDIHRQFYRQPGAVGSSSSLSAEDSNEPVVAGSGVAGPSRQKRFFEFPGPLFSVRISPRSCVLPIGKTRNFHAVARDRNKKQVDENLKFEWEIMEGSGILEPTESEIVKFTAPAEPGLVKIKVTVSQADIICTGDALITVTESLLPEIKKGSDLNHGLPGYTYKKAPGELWRSYYDEEQNVIVVNNGHRDFVFSSKNRSLKLRYISRLFAKELVFRNFKGIPPDGLLERMIELTLYMEENL